MLIVVHASQDLRASAHKFGAMGLNHAYNSTNAVSDAEALAVVACAAELAPP